jgi:hypothetical protein
MRRKDESREGRRERSEIDLDGRDERGGRTLWVWVKRVRVRAWTRQIRRGEGGLVRSLRLCCINVRSKCERNSMRFGRREGPSIWLVRILFETRIERRLVLASRRRSG